MTEQRTRRAKGWRQAAAGGLSVAAHVAVIALLWTHAPRLLRIREQAGPPEPVIPVLILPRTPPTPPGASRKSEPIRLHRRRLRPELASSNEVPPLVAPRAESEPPTVTPKPAVNAPRATVQPTPASQLGNVLRASPIGCANPAILSPDERQACLARLGRNAASAPYLGPAIGDKQGAFDAPARRSGSQAPPPTASGASNRNKPLYTPNLAPLRP